MPGPSHRPGFRHVWAQFSQVGGSPNMSDATRDALQLAIQAHVADEFEDADDILLTDWVLGCAAVRMDPAADINCTSYSWWSNGGSYHALRGLVSLLGDWTREA